MSQPSGHSHRSNDADQEGRCSSQLTPLTSHVVGRPHPNEVRFPDPETVYRDVTSAGGTKHPSTSSSVAQGAFSQAFVLNGTRLTGEFGLDELRSYDSYAAECSGSEDAAFLPDAHELESLLTSPAEASLPTWHFDGRLPSSSDNAATRPGRPFSAHSEQKTIAQTCKAIVPGWADVPEESIVVRQILAGLTNQLFQVSINLYEDRQEAPSQIASVAAKSEDEIATNETATKVLFRVYGFEIGSLYEPSDEVRSFKRLGALGIGPRLIGEFPGGRIEEWIDGGPLKTSDLGRVPFMLSIARILAQVHSLPMTHNEEGPPCAILRRWKIAASCAMASPDQPHRPEGDSASVMSGFTQRLLPLGLQALVSDADFFIDYVERGCSRDLVPLRINERIVKEQSNSSAEVPKGSPLLGLSTSGADEVSSQLTEPVNAARTLFLTPTFCHNDIQPNNIMLTPDALRLIDFEYGGINWPAFDIACYFFEMTCDYTYDKWPFFVIDHTLYPQMWQQRMFVAVYLKYRMNRAITMSDPEVAECLRIVDIFQLIIHLTWIFWSVIRAPCVPTSNAFDFLTYAKQRRQLYFDWLQRLLPKRHAGSLSSECHSKCCCCV